MRGVDVWAVCKEAGGGGWVGTRAAAAHPVLEAALDEVHADEHYGWACDDGRTEPQQDARWDKGDEDLDQGADGRGADESAVPAGAGKMGAIVGGWAVSVCVHLLKGALGDGDEVERDANH